jgi:hypothetical protein
MAARALFATNFERSQMHMKAPRRTVQRIIFCLHLPHNNRKHMPVFGTACHLTVRILFMEIFGWELFERVQRKLARCASLGLLVLIISTEGFVCHV